MLRVFSAALGAAPGFCVPAWAAEIERNTNSGVTETKRGWMGDEAADGASVNLQDLRRLQAHITAIDAMGGTHLRPLNSGAPR